MRHKIHHEYQKLYWIKYEITNKILMIILLHACLFTYQAESQPITTNANLSFLFVKTDHSKHENPVMGMFIETVVGTEVFKFFNKDKLQDLLSPLQIDDKRLTLLSVLSGK